MSSVLAKGFTLIELMIVMAIIVILAGIGVPIYLDYARSAANGACLAEAKGYAMSVLVAIDNSFASIPVPVESACSRITNAAAIPGLTREVVIEAYPKSPGDTGVSCNLNANAVCVIDPGVGP